MTSPFLALLAPLYLAVPSPLTIETAPPPAKESEPDLYAAHVTVDAEKLREGLSEKEVARQQEFFEERLSATFAGKTPPAEPGSDDMAEVRFVLSWANFDEFQYSVAIEVTLPDGKKQETSFTFQGIEEDLFARMKDEVPNVLTWLERPEDNTPPPPAESHDPPPKVKHPKPGPAPKRFWITAGVGTAIAAGGLGVLGFGAYRLSQGDQTTLLDDGLTEETTKNQRQGIIWTAAGAGAVIAGVALIVVDTTTLWKKRKARSLSVAPFRQQATTGLTLQGRF